MNVNVLLTIVEEEIALVCSNGLIIFLLHASWRTSLKVFIKREVEQKE